MSSRKLTADVQHAAEAVAAMERLRSENLSELARFLGISRAAVHGWVVVPWKRVAAVARYTGLKPHQLRPDLYPPP